MDKKYLSEVLFLAGLFVMAFVISLWDAPFFQEIKRGPVSMVHEAASVGGTLTLPLKGKRSPHPDLKKK